MAVIVDKQNEHDSDYIPMSKDLNKSIAFQTAVELVLMGKEQPSGYTEPILHNGRLKFKNNLNKLAFYKNCIKVKSLLKYLK